MNNFCEHKITKKNFPFGRKSGAEIKCKICGKPLSRWEIRKRKEKKIQEKKKIGWRH